MATSHSYIASKLPTYIHEKQKNILFTSCLCINMTCLLVLIEVVSRATCRGNRAKVLPAILILIVSTLRLWDDLAKEIRLAVSVTSFKPLSLYNLVNLTFFNLFIFNLVLVFNIRFIYLLFIPLF